MFLVVGIEIYDDSPFTKEIEILMDQDVGLRYILICIIFLLGNFCLFCILSTWLRIRVTDRMRDLKNKITASGSNEKHKYSGVDEDDAFDF